jgi:hypothetical protein
MASKLAVCPICGIEARRSFQNINAETGEVEGALQIIKSFGPCTESSLAPVPIKCCPHLWLAAMDAGITQGVVRVLYELPPPSAAPVIRDMRPIPETPKAIAQGCRCSVARDSLGTPYPSRGGGQLLAVEKGCPVHD